MTSVPELAGEVSRGMLFGEGSGNFLESAETERREKEKKIKLEKKKREEAIRRSEEEKRRQELADFQFAVEEEERINKPLRQDHRSPEMGGFNKRGPLRGRRGFLDSRHENKFFQKERQIRNHLNQLQGGERIHSNTAQIQFWQGKPQPQYTSFYSGTNREECEEEERYLSTDQFQDAHDESPSPLNTSQPSESSSFQSFTSSVSASPVPAYVAQPEAPERLSPEEKNHTPRQKRGNRIAANFSNRKEDETSDTTQQDFFPVMSSAAQPLAPSGSRNSHTNNALSINNVRASQRIITPTSNISAAILRHLSKNGDFVLDDRDFPPLK